MHESQFISRRAGNCPFISGETFSGNMSDPKLGKTTAAKEQPLPSIAASFQEMGRDCFDGNICNQSQFKPQIKRKGEENISSCEENSQIGFDTFKHNYFLWEIRNSDFFLERVSFDELTV